MEYSLDRTVKCVVNLMLLEFKVGLDVVLELVDAMLTPLEPWTYLRHWSTANHMDMCMDTITKPTNSKHFSTHYPYLKFSTDVDGFDVETCVYLCMKYKGQYFTEYGLQHYAFKDHATEAIFKTFYYFEKNNRVWKISKVEYWSKMVAMLNEFVNS